MAGEAKRGAAPAVKLLGYALVLLVLAAWAGAESFGLLVPAPPRCGAACSWWSEHVLGSRWFAWQSGLDAGAGLMVLARWARVRRTQREQRALVASAADGVSW